MFKFLLKLTIAAALILWLTKSGKLDFSLLKLSLGRVDIWIFCLATFLINIFITSLRWKKILEMKTNHHYSSYRVFKLCWIGSFFSTILPGAVSGDFVKILYARDMDQQLSKTFLLTSVLMDRVLGLIGLLGLLGFGVLFNYSSLISISPELNRLLLFNLFLFSMAILFILVLFAPHALQRPLLKFLDTIPVLGKKLSGLFHEMWTIGKNRMMVLQLIFISMVAQTFNIFGFFTITSPYFRYSLDSQTPIHAAQAFSFIPVGLMSTAIPITPAGIGVGHAIFDKLFSFFHIINGASLFNLYFLGLMLINLLGAIPYLFYRQNNVKRQVLKEIQQEN